MYCAVILSGDVATFKTVRFCFGVCSTEDIYTHECMALTQTLEASQSGLRSLVFYTTSVAKFLVCENISVLFPF